MKTIYIKAKNNLISEYCQITRIVENEGKRWVIKEPVNEAGKQHITEMEYAAEQLKDVFDRIDICSCCLSGNHVEFPYIDDKSYLQVIKNAAEQSVEQYIRAWKDFLDLIEPRQRVPFQASSEFEKLFGNDYEFEGTDSYEKCAFDINPENLLILTNNRSVLIDYEWWLPVPVPVALIQYHLILNMWQSHPEIRHPDMTLDMLTNGCGLLQEEVEKYNKCIEHFYSHITGKDREEKTWYLYCEQYVKQSEETPERIIRLQLADEQKKSAEAVKNWQSSIAYSKELERQLNTEQAKNAEAVRNWQSSVAYSEELEKQLSREQEKTAETVRNWQSSVAYSEELEKRLSREQEKTAETVKNWQGALAYLNVLEQQIIDKEEYNNSLLCQLSDEKDRAERLEEEGKRVKKQYEINVKAVREELSITKLELEELKSSFRWKLVHPVRSMREALGVEGTTEDK